MYRVCYAYHTPTRQAGALVLIVTALGAVTGFLFLAILGAMRETVLLRGEVAALSQLITHPPAPSFAKDRSRVPEALASILRGEFGESARDSRRMIAFVSPGCQPCEALGRELAVAVGPEGLDNEALLFVVWAATEVEARDFTSRLPGHAVADTGGTLARACEVRATPTVFIIDGDLRVTDFHLEGDAQWITTRLTSHRLEPVA